MSPQYSFPVSKAFDYDKKCYLYAVDYVSKSI